MPDSEIDVIPAEEEEVGSSQTEIHFNDNDDKIMAATLKAFESGSVTPLIKEELRCTIQSRRLAEGKGELKVEFKSPPKRKEMTDDERKRAVKRRQQNREAAQRFRQRQKDTSDYLTAKIRRLEKASNTLVHDLKSLKKERDELKKMLDEHLLFCTNHVTVPSDLDHIIPDLFPSSTSTVNSTPQPTPECPDSANSCGSSTVFFPEDVVDIQSIQQTYEEDTQMIELDGPVAFEDVFQNGSVIQTTTFDPGMYYEEIVVEGDSTDDSASVCGDFSSVRLESCSSVDTADTASVYGSVSDTLSISESTSDLRHSLASAYSRVHMNSCSSEAFETVYLEDDFLLTDDNSP